MRNKHLTKTVSQFTICLRHVHRLCLIVERAAKQTFVFGSTKVLSLRSSLKFYKGNREVLKRQNNITMEFSMKKTYL